jgi:hypothetical protein
MRLFVLISFVLIEFSGLSQQWNSVVSTQGSGIIINIEEENGQLYISGGLTEVNGLLTENLTSYNGLVWSTFVPGVNSSIESFISYDDKIFFGGTFFNAGGSSSIDALATWDGSNWGGFGNQVNRQIRDLEVYQGKLFGIGNFSDLFGVSGLNHVFEFDGTSFSGLNGGLLGAPVSSRQIEVFDELLIAGGYFLDAGGVPVNNLAAWDGNQWSAYAGGTDAIVTTMFTDTINEYLYISGDFTSVGGVLPVNYFAKWDGENWFDVGGGIHCQATDIELFQNQIYIGGCMEQVGGKPIKYIARYNGTEWDSLGASINNQGASTLAVFQDELYVGGAFTQIGDTVVPGLAKWSFPLDSACKDMYAGIGAHPDTIYTGQLPYTFRSGCYGNGSLQWEFSDGYISPKGHTTYDFNNTPGTYDIMLTAQCGTYADTVYSQVVIVSNLGIEQEDQIEMKIYPNPSDGKISIYAEELIGKEVSISIFDIQGKEVLHKEMRFNSSTVQLDLQLSKGSYEMLVMVGGEKMTQTLVIE